MAYPISTILSFVDSLITADDGELTHLQRRWQIRAAVDRYAIERPRQAVVDVPGSGGGYYPLTGDDAILPGWADGFSAVLSIEYPAADVSSNGAPSLLEDGAWQDDYEAGSVKYLRLPNHAPAATETMRIRYSAPYAWTAGLVATDCSQIGHGLVEDDFAYQEGVNWVKASDPALATHQVTDVDDADNFTVALLEVDIARRDFYPVCYLAASLCCQAIATRYSRTNDSTIQADSVQHISRAGEFSRRAKEFMTAYSQALGKAGETSGPAGSAAFVDFDAAPGWPGNRDFLFHGRGGR